MRLIWQPRPLFTQVRGREILRTSPLRSSTKFISKVVHRTDLIRGCWNQGKALGAAVHYRPALANEVSQKRALSNHLPERK